MPLRSPSLPIGKFRGTTACPKCPLSSSTTEAKSVRSRSRWLTTMMCGMSSLSPRRHTRSVTTWMGRSHGGPPPAGRGDQLRAPVAGRPGQSYQHLRYGLPRCPPRVCSARVSLEQILNDDEKLAGLGADQLQQLVGLVEYDASADPFPVSGWDSLVWVVEIGRAHV